MADRNDNFPLPPHMRGVVSRTVHALLPDHRSFYLHERAMYTWRYTPGDAGREEERIYRLVVPAGFEHDFASVPRLLWVLISPLDLGIASVFHDWLYRKQGRVETLRWQEQTRTWESLTKPWSRFDSDRLFARIMREQAVPKWRRRLAFKAVRFFGQEPWMEEALNTDEHS